MIGKKTAQTVCRVGSGGFIVSSVHRSELRDRSYELVRRFVHEAVARLRIHFDIILDAETV